MCLTRPLRRRSGFSLVEMMVAITIIGVAAALSIPKISAITNETKIQRAAQALQNDVQQAFAIAGRNRSPVALRWVSGSMQMRITNLANTLVFRREGLGTSAGYGLSSSEVTVWPTTLTVFPNGLAADTMFIKLSRKGYTRTIRVSKSGMVRTK
jgi:type II secretion system protein H